MQNWLLFVLLVGVVSCTASRHGEADAIVIAERMVAAGDKRGARQALEGQEPWKADSASHVLSLEGFGALLADPASRAEVRALVQQRALGSRIEMVRASERGEPLFVTIKIVDRHTGLPVQGARVDLVQTDAAGYYEPKGERGTFNPRLFGTAITDHAGRIDAATIRPGYYAPEYGADEPAHIHFTVFSGDILCRAAEFFFADDARLTAEFVRDAQRKTMPNSLTSEDAFFRKVRP